ncbi:hypothetical protein JCM10207_008992 [Rhodosporidiobolus poonsookiae]
MQRFRRKSESKRRAAKGKDRDSSGGPNEGAASPAAEGMLRSPSGSLLPEPSDFRTSLILPQMLKRFSLLRSDDGQLVDMETMQSHLAHQRQTGRLTAYEVDAILSQYRLQSAYETTPSMPSPPKRKRIDWSKMQPGIEEELDTGSAFGGNDSMRTSFATTSEDHTSHSLAHSQSSSGHSGFLSPSSNTHTFPATVFSPTASLSRSGSFSGSGSSPGGSPNPANPPSGSPTTQYPYPYRRGGNSMFGGRAHGAREIKMLKSGSTQSIASLGGGSVKSGTSRAGSPVKEAREAKETDEEDKAAEEQERAEEPSTEEEVEQPASSNGHAEVVEPAAEEDDAFADADERGGSPTPRSQTVPLPSAAGLGVPQLSSKQLRRISRALVDIEQELRLTLAADEEEDAEMNGEAQRALEEDAEEDEEVEQPGGADELEDGEEEDARPISVDGDGTPRKPVPRLEIDLHSENSEDATSPISPISPVTESDLRGLSTFDIPSPTLLDPIFSNTLSLPSPSANDTEPVDPFYARLQIDAAKVPLPPSTASSSPRMPVSVGSSPVIPAGSSPILSDSATSSPRMPAPSSPLPAPPSPALRSATSSPHPSTRSVSDHEPLTSSPSAPAISLPPPAGLANISIPPRSARLRELSVETDSTITPAGSSPSTPGAFSFPGIPSRTDSGVTARPGTAQREEELEGEGEGEGEEERLADEPSEMLEAAAASLAGEGEVTMTDEGPFDLSLGGIRLPREQALREEEEGEEEDAEAGAQAVGVSGFDSSGDEQDDTERSSRRSPSIISTGSSFHEAKDMADSDDDELVTTIAPSSASPSTATFAASSRPHSFPDRPSPPAIDAPADGEDSPSLLRPMSLPLDRRPSNELLQVLAAASRSESRTGEASSGTDGDTSDLILEDLLAIQETLVRAAARRAARMGSNGSEGGAALATPSSIASSSMAEPFSLSAVASFAKTPHPDVDPPPGRKGSVESTVSPTSISDLGAQLAGLGLTSLPPFDLSQTASSLRNSRRTSASGGGGKRDSRRTSEMRRRSEGPGRRGSGEDDAGRRDSEMVPGSSRMTVQTSQTSSTSPATNAIATPSTNQSDAFEFSSLVGSPETGSWEDAQEHLREESVASSSPYLNYSAASSAPGSPPRDGEQAESDGLERRMEDDDLFVEDEQGDASPELLASASASPSLGAPADIDTDSFLRVPRNKPIRDRSHTTSMLVRDVRNQATLATIALKKQGGPTSPPMRQLARGKSKSIRKGSISSPQLVSGPVDIPAVPIAKPGFTDSSRTSSSSSSKPTRSKSRKDKDGDGEKKGLGLRFKMLLKKPSARDQLGHLNGDEVTPFVDFDPSEEPASAHITPPNQDIARFESPSSFPQTPDVAPTPEHSRSPTYQPSSVLPIVEERPERSSPAPSIGTASPVLGGPTSPTGSTNSRSLSRIMSRIRSNGRCESDTSSMGAAEGLRSSAMSVERSSSPQQQLRAYSPTTAGRRPSLDQEVARARFGSREEQHPSRAPASYHVGSPRARQRAETEGRFENNAYDVQPTAPLSVTKSPEGTYVFPPPVSGRRTSGGHAPRASIDSMRKLWQAAEDLGLPPEKVQELVDSAYANSPTTSSHAHSGSTSSTVGGRSANDGFGAGRRPSEASAFSHRRAGSVNSRKSVHDRVPTPPPAGRHRRQASASSSRNAGPVPSMPSSYSFPAGQQDNSRLSVYSTGPAGSLIVPHSPSLGSLASRKSSEYANSFIDFYTAGDDDDAHYPPMPPPLQGRRPSLAPSVDEQLAMQQRAEEESTVRLNPIGEFDHSAGARASFDADGDADEREHPSYRDTLQMSLETPNPDQSDDVVWQVLDDLRNHRLSTLSKDSSFGFDSRHSSLEVEREGGEAGSSNVAGLLRHRDRKRESEALAPWQNGRYPSIYMKDESRLLELGEQGGIASAPEGHFYVRPKEEGVPEVPQVPEEHRGQRVGRR